MRRRLQAWSRSLFLGLVFCLPLVFAAAFRDWQQYVEEIRQWFAQVGVLAPAIFTLGSALLTAIGMPRLIFCAVGGVLFGGAWGFLWSHLGTVLGAYGAFVVARWTARDYLLARYPSLQSLAAKIDDSGWWSVILIRQMPISGLYNDILLALSPVTHGAFWAGTLLGFLPLGVTATLIGAGLMQADISQLTAYLASAAIAMVALGGAWNWLASRTRKPDLRY
ncbi:TVP38/TMEM64 family protein [Methylolobus aquaticus]